MSAMWVQMYYSLYIRNHTLQTYITKSCLAGMWSSAPTFGCECPLFLHELQLTEGFLTITTFNSRLYFTYLLTLILKMKAAWRRKLNLFSMMRFSATPATHFTQACRQSWLSFHPHSRHPFYKYLFYTSKKKKKTINVNVNNRNFSFRIQIAF